MTSRSELLLAAGDHQQRCGKLRVSVGAPVSKRLEEHHGHRAERDGLRHAGAGQEADPGSERWGLRVQGGAAACDWSVWVQGRPFWPLAPSTPSPAPVSWFRVRRRRRRWRPCTSGSRLRPPQHSCCCCHSNGLVVGGVLFREGLWQQSGGAMVIGSISSILDQSEPRYGPADPCSSRGAPPLPLHRLFVPLRGPLVVWTRPEPSRRPCWAGSPPGAWVGLGSWPTWRPT